LASNISSSAEYIKMSASDSDTGDMGDLGTAMAGAVLDPTASTSTSSSCADSPSSSPTAPLDSNPGAQHSRSASKIVAAFETAEGVGAHVKRSIGNPALWNLSPFLILDYARVGPGAGFPDHPHRGMATVTYVLEG
jgi:hypothetical protein